MRAGCGRRCMDCSAAGSVMAPGGWSWPGCRAGRDAEGLITWDVSVDSTIARAHQHAAGARTRGDAQAEPPGGVAAEPADHALGRSRGGLSTKVHLACDKRQKPLSVVITAGQRGGSPQFQAVLEGIRVPAVSGARSPRKPTRSATARTGAAAEAARRVRPRDLPAAPRGRVRHWPAQAQPGSGHPLRQARRPLRSDRAHRRDQRVAPPPLMKHAPAGHRP